MFRCPAKGFEPAPLNNLHGSCRRLANTGAISLFLFPELHINDSQRLTSKPTATQREREKPRCLKGREYTAADRHLPMLDHYSLTAPASVVLVKLLLRVTRPHPTGGCSPPICYMHHPTLPEVVRLAPCNTWHRRCTMVAKPRLHPTFSASTSSHGR